MAPALRGSQKQRGQEEDPLYGPGPPLDNAGLLEGDSYFSDIAKKLASGSKAERIAAVQAMKGRVDVLLELASACGDADVRLSCVSLLAGNPIALAELAKHCHFADSRAQAVEQLKGNTESLMDVACSSAFRGARLNAAAHLPDEALVSVAINSRFIDVRRAALEMLSKDAASIIMIAKESQFAKTRTASVGMLEGDAGSLCRVVLESGHRDSRKAAIRLLRRHTQSLHEDVFAEMASLSPEEEVRSLAVSRLSSSPHALRKVISGTRYKDTRSMALMLYSYLVSQTEDPAILADIAKISPHPECRAAAVEKLAGRKIELFEIAQSSRFRDARDWALAKLGNEAELLRRLRKHSRYSDTRRKAHRILSETSLFERLISGILM